MFLFRKIQALDDSGTHSPVSSTNMYNKGPSQQCAPTELQEPAGVRAGIPFCEIARGGSKQM